MSSDDTIVTVNASGLLTMVANGNVMITATWTEGNISDDTNITISGEIAPSVSGTSSISGDVKLRLGFSRTYTATFTDTDGNVVDDVKPIWTITNNNFALSKIAITYPTTSQIKLQVDNDDSLHGETFTLNLVDVDGLYTSSTLEIKIIEGF